LVIAHLVAIPEHPTRRKTMLASYQAYSDHTFKAHKLDQQTLQSAEIHDCTFKQCSFVSAVLSECRFIHCTFKDCDFSLAQIPGCLLSGLQFDRCKLVGINWTEADWTSVRLGEPLAFKECALNHSTFIGLDLQEVRMTDCTVIGVDFREANLSLADFSGSDLQESLFLHTDLTRANLNTARNYTIAPAENKLSKARFALPEALSLLYNLDILLDEDT
jgi:fluoroquinolone resistance protein